MELEDDLQTIPEEKVDLSGDGIIELENGELEVDLEARPGQTGWEQRTAKGEFDENLAEVLEPGQRCKIGQALIEAIKEDEESRKDWDERAESALALLGVQDIPEDSLPFKGASRVMHPAIATACVQFQSRALEELFPSQGPVKSLVVGRKDEEREAQADRVSNFMNYQLTEMDGRYFWEVDQMLMYLPIDGSAFKKVFYDPRKQMTRSTLVRARDMIVNYDATSLEDAERISHRYVLTRNAVDRKVQAGEFIEDHKLESDTQANITDQREFEDQADDRQEVRDEDDTTYTIYECHTMLSPEVASEFDDCAGECEFAMPYIVTIEEESNEILCIRRNWEEDDERMEPVIHFTHYKYLPGLGFYGFGLLHVIGSLGRAASGALRALLDGAATASLQGGFKSKEAKMAGEMILTPGSWQDVDMAAEDLAKAFYTPPFKEPSSALFAVLELLVNGIEKFSSTTEAMVGEMDAKGAPVGSVLAMIEQGSKVFSAIHKRLHQAARQEFKLIARSNYLYMEDRYPYKVDGEEREVLREDFDDRVDVIPVSDPNIYSSTQRIAMAQAVLELMDRAPDLYDEDARRRAHTNLMRAMKVPDPEEYLPERRTLRLDPVSENQSMLTGRPVQAFYEQDHAAHLAMHENFAAEVQGLPMDPQSQQATLMAIQAHMSEHYAMGYRQKIEREIGMPLPDFDQTNWHNNEDMPIELEIAISRAVALHTQPVEPPPSEEEMQAMEAQADIQRKDMEAQADIQRKDAEAQAKIAREDALAQAKARRELESAMNKEGLLPSEREMTRGGFSS